VSVVSGVIFDVDGVLVDSYVAHFESWKQLGERHGFGQTEEQFARTFGRTSHEILADLGLGLTNDEMTRLSDEKEAIFRAIISTGFPVMPGAVPLIDSLAEDGFRLAVGSSGPPENVALTLAELGRGSLFRAAVTGADVTRGKPDPEVFLRAAERLELPPESCAVIEDAAPGISAAKRAGMAAIGLVSRGRTSQELAAADHVVHHLAELTPSSIRSLITHISARAD